MSSPTRLVLASSSPRRRQLLAEAGYRFEVDPAGIDEPEPDGPVPIDQYVAELAYRKAHTVAERYDSDTLILAADTSVSVADQILNKPIDRSDAERMLRLQQGHDITVATGVCLYRPELHDWVGGVEVSICRMRDLTEDELEAVLDSGTWQGRAGGYGVQDDDPIIAITQGSVSNVVGLPMERLARMLQTYGFAMISSSS